MTLTPDLESYAEKMRQRRRVAAHNLRAARTLQHQGDQEAARGDERDHVRHARHQDAADPQAPRLVAGRDPVLGRSLALAGPLNAAFEKPISACHSKFGGKVPAGKLVGKVEDETTRYGFQGSFVLLDATTGKILRRSVEPPS